MKLTGRFIFQPPKPRYIADEIHNTDLAFRLGRSAALMRPWRVAAACLRCMTWLRQVKTPLRVPTGRLCLRGEQAKSSDFFDQTTGFVGNGR